MKKIPKFKDGLWYIPSLKKTLTIMKLSGLIIFLGVAQVFATETYSQAERISLKMENVSVETVLKSIEDQSNYYFLLNQRLIDVNRKVDIDVNNKSINEILGQLFAGTEVKHMVSKRQIILSTQEIYGLHEAASEAIQQQKTVTGKVSDPDGNPLIGVTVIIKETNKGTLTDAEGKFALELSPGDRTIAFSFIGMKTQEVDISDRTYIETVMELEIQQIDEVIAVGYMTQKKADLTGSIAVVTKSSLEKNNYPNLLRTIQGKVPGVYILTDGDPGSSKENIQIRGITSVNASPPLIVIDGVATTINLKDLNPNDIESIQILKDAASASIYGARAAGGVILVNTRQGRKGEFSVSYNVKASISSTMKRPELCNTEELGRAWWQAYIYDGVDPNVNSLVYDYDWHYDDTGIPVLDKVTPVEWLNLDHTQKSADTDWWGEVFKPAFQQDHQLTVTLGSDKYQSMFSINMINDNGNMVHTYLKKYSIRLNSSYKLLDGKLIVGENINVMHTKSRADLSYLMWNAMLLPSIIPVHDIYGGWGGSPLDFLMIQISNPVYVLDATKGNADNVNKAIGSFYVGLSPFKGFTIRSQVGIDYSNRYNRHIDPLYKEAGHFNDANNGIYMYTDYATNYTWTNTLNYSLNTQNHNLDILAGFEVFNYKYEFFNASHNDILLEDYDFAYISTATGDQKMSGMGDKSSMLSYFGKVNYSFKNKYLLSFTGRFDGSSKFPKANQFGFFPAISAGWRLSEEEFLNFLQEAISDLKIRVSWGTNGNSNIPSNGILSTFITDYTYTSYMIGGAPSGQMPSGYVASHIGNPNLMWESTTQTNIGLDFGIFKSRLTGSIDWYKKVTDGMLFEPPSNPLLGEGARMWYNAGDMTNKGLEALFTFNSKPLSDFTYSVTGNISLYRNKIDNIPQGMELQYGGNGLDDDILGRPLRSVYGFVADGIFKTQEEVDKAPEQPGKGLGRIKYKDLDHDGTISWLYDQTWIGNYDPDFMYGIEFTGKYKNFDLSMFWQGVVGNDVYNDWMQYDDFASVAYMHSPNLGKGVLDTWFYDNTNSDKPALTWLNSNDEMRISTYFLQSGSYLKLRNIEIGYTFSNNICNKLRMKYLRIYATAQNIINLHKWWGNDAFTGWDPEVSQYTHTWNDDYDFSVNYSVNYPRPAIFCIGLNTTF